MMNFLQMISKIKQREIKAVFFSFLFVVVLMTAYYILRPVRDAMASDWTDAEVSLLWTLNFFISAGIVALYGAAVSKFRFRLLSAYYVWYLCFVIRYILFLRIHI
jgi:AAA family ATP:ADP antiporter